MCGHRSTIFITFIFLLGIIKVYTQSDLIDQKVSSDLNGAVGIEFVDSNLWCVWERDGIIQIFIDEEKLEKPLLDISAEVSSAGDLGLLGMALHPHFKANGFMYLLYTVEPNYLRHEGSDPFIKEEADEWGATIGRLTRYQVDTNGFMKVLPESRAFCWVKPFDLPNIQELRAGQRGI